MSRNALANTEENPASDLRGDESVVQIFGLHILDLSGEFFKTIRLGYKEDEDIMKVVRILKNKTIESKEIVASLPKEYRVLMEEGKF